VAVADPGLFCSGKLRCQRRR